MKLLDSLRTIADRIKQDSVTIYLVARDIRTPIYVRILALAVAAYALSPIDLIPDVIPVLGYLDDLILLPLGIYFVIKLTPRNVIKDCRTKAKALPQRPTSVAAAVVIVAIWIACAVIALFWLRSLLDN